ncbi:MAG TPA: L-threonylcarbamoyladenylate synthase [Woeseiaceae bacterium]|nr:L-threonylcarbamoyladenylate synthase [Woeseiaceae bacterium]
MALSIPLQKAVRVLNEGGVIAYPTEGVFGLGCLPPIADAVERILCIKQRDPSMGLILIASSLAQLEPYAAVPADERELTGSLEEPVTWVLPATSSTPLWIRGRRPGVAVRITAHPVAAALCDAADSAIVSTSANVAGQPPARNSIVLRRRFGRLVDYVVPGNCGPAKGASEIRDYASGRVLRPSG